MKETIFTQESVSATESGIVNHIYQLRHDTFIGRLNWAINSHNGMERDQFDDMHPYHIAVIGKDHQVNGCWRALPTTGDYMLRSVFSDMFQGEPITDDPGIWEISRFAVRKGSAQTEKGYMSEITMDMVRSFYDFAIAHDIYSYVTVTTVACERLLRQLGVDMRRLGSGKVMQLGQEKSVALRIDVNEKLKLYKH